jgi:hypothetical protein
MKTTTVQYVSFSAEEIRNIVMGYIVAERKELIIDAIKTICGGNVSAVVVAPDGVVTVKLNEINTSGFAIAVTDSAIADAAIDAAMGHETKVELQRKVG